MARGVSVRCSPLRESESCFVERSGKIAHHELPALRMLDQNGPASGGWYLEDVSATALREFRRFRQETLALLVTRVDQSRQRIAVRRQRGDSAIAAHAAVRLGHNGTQLNQIRVLREGFGGGTAPARDRAPGMNGLATIPPERLPRVGLLSIMI